MILDIGIRGRFCSLHQSWLVAGPLRAMRGFPSASGAGISNTDMPVAAAFPFFLPVSEQTNVCHHLAFVVGGLAFNLRDVLHAGSGARFIDLCDVSSLRLGPIFDFVPIAVRMPAKCPFGIHRGMLNMGCRL